MNILYASLMILILIILSCTLKNVEKFEDSNQKLKVKTRGCEMHLTNDPELCNKLEPYYKMGNIQLQVAINNMKKLKDSSSKQAYNILRYIQSKKKQIPINSCKIKVPDLIEIDQNESDSSKYPWKTITSYVDYDPISFKGYCLLDTNYDMDKLSVKMKVDKDYSDIMNTDNMLLTSQIQDIDNNDTTYAALEFKGDIYSTILKNSKALCKENNKNIDIEDKAVFVKVTCHLENTKKISASKVEIVQYVKKENKFTKVNKYGQLKEIVPQKLKGDDLKENTDISVTETSKENDVKEEKSETSEPKQSESESPEPKQSESESPESKQSEKPETKQSESTQSDSQKIMKEFEKNFFGFTYIENSSLVFSSYTVPVKMFMFDFDICSSIQSYNTIDEIKDPYDENEKSKIKLSFTEDLRISPIMIKQTMNIPFEDDTKNISQTEDVKVTDDINDDITNLIKNKINDIDEENKDIKKKLKEYDEALDKTTKNYVNLQSLCQENQDTYSKCIDRANIDFGNLYKLITIAKTGLSDLIQRNNATKESLINTQEIMSLTQFSIEDMNQDILNNTPKNKDGSLRNKGVPISFEKFSPFISNDDCFYFQLNN